MRRFLHTLLVALLIAGLGLPANAEQFIGGAPQPQLTADLITSLEYKGTPTGGTATFSRGSARVFEDWEGNYVRTANTNEAVFKARRLHNLLATSSVPATQNVTLGYGTYMLQVSGTGTATSAAVGATITGGGAASSGTPNIFNVTAYGTVSVTVAGSLTGFALYNITGDSDQTTEREFIQSDVSYGAGVVGVKYFDTELDGTPIPAATLTGYQYDGASTNKIAGAYNAVGPDMLGSELLVNGNFTAWTADNPDSWTVVEDGDASSNVTQNPAGQCNIISTGDSAYIYQIKTTTGRRYTYSVEVKSITGTILIKSGTTTLLTVTTTGIKTASFTATSSTFIIVNSGACNAVIDDASLKELGASKLDGTFWSGGGTGAKNTAAATAAIPGQTHGGTGSTTITDVSAVITSTNKYKRLTPATKWYVTTASGSDATVDFTGALSAAAHTISLVAYGATASDVLTLGTNTVAGTPQTVTTAPLLYTQTLTANAADTMRLTVADGDTITWCLMQAETGTVPTSRIIVEGAAASRSRDALTIPVADGTNFRQREGTASVDVTWGFGSASFEDGYVNILAANANTNSSIYYYHATSLRLRTIDGTNTPQDVVPDFALGDSITYKQTHSTAKNKLNVYSTTGGWAAATAYDGAYTIGTSWQFFYSSAYPAALKNLRVLGTADPGGM